jgi:hypothetical protein
MLRFVAPRSILVTNQDNTLIPAVVQLLNVSLRYPVCLDVFDGCHCVLLECLVQLGLRASVYVLAFAGRVKISALILIMGNFSFGIIGLKTLAATYPQI